MGPENLCVLPIFINHNKEYSDKEIHCTFVWKSGQRAMLPLTVSPGIFWPSHSPGFSVWDVLNNVLD